LASTAFNDLCMQARSFGVSLSQGQREQLEAYISELWSWQRKINLTGLGSKDHIIRELLLDSLIPVPHLAPTGKLLDLGSGAGFPAIPLKICLPDVQFHLIEPKVKKTAFLRQIIRILELRGIDVIQARVEQIEGPIDTRSYDMITARAVTSLSQIIEWCGPLLSAKGVLVSFQGSTWKKALEESADAIIKQKMILSERLTYKLPGKTAERNILLFSRKDD